MSETSQTALMLRYKKSMQSTKNWLNLQKNRMMNVILGKNMINAVKELPKVAYFPKVAYGELPKVAYGMNKRLMDRHVEQNRYNWHDDFQIL